MSRLQEDCCGPNGKGPVMRYEVYRDESAKREWRWRFISSNGKTIAVSSEGYSSKASCLNGIRLMKESADAPVVEV